MAKDWVEGRMPLGLTEMDDVDGDGGKSNTTGTSRLARVFYARALIIVGRK